MIARKTMTIPASPLATSEDLLAVRRRKLAALQAAGFDYPNNFSPSHSAAALDTMFGDSSRETLLATPATAQVAGRVVLKRVMGKSIFFTVQDNGSRLQFYLQQAQLGAEQFAAAKDLDLGDIIGADGVVFKTKTGELSLKVSRWVLLVKALRPLPDKHHGLSSGEAQYRQRYLALLADPVVRRVFTRRAQILRYLRNFFHSRDYVEIESPILQNIPGGAAARPFVTHGEALGRDFYLRIAQELYIKRMLVGGFNRVFELNRNFRNEGISPRHNPEFTMLEFNSVYQTHEDFMNLTEELLTGVVKMITGGESVLHYQGREISFTRPFARLSPEEALRRYCPNYSATQLTDEKFLHQELLRLAPDNCPAPDTPCGELQFKLFEHQAEALLWQPTFIIDYPAALSPLAKRAARNPMLAERFELFIAGRELVNGFSELNDPDLQGKLFKQQAALKEAGEHEAMFFDDDYIRALEHGLPPNAGGGLGVDRLVMLLTDAPAIRDVILFPQLRDK